MQKELILGPPGTGKTTTLINKVEELLEQGVNPERIAYVSFTRKAAYEAKDRACERFGFKEDRMPWFRTCHGVAYRHLNLGDADMMTDTHWDDVSQCLGINLKPLRKMTDGVSQDSAIAFHLHLAENLCRGYGEHFERVAGGRQAREMYFGNLARGGGLRDFVRAGDFLSNYKANSGLYDFSDMLRACLHVPPLDVDYAIIDEAQDLSHLQWEFCRHMFQDVKTCWIAGDDDQAIYSWAGADLNTFLHMDARRTVLQKSHRLPRAIWEFANGIVGMIDDRYPKDWGPRDDEGIVKWISSVNECDLANGETWMILTRTKSQQQNYVYFLRSHGYVYRKNGYHSINARHLKMAKAWTNLLRGNRITASAARVIYDNLIDEHLEPGAKEKLASLDENTRLRMEQLNQEYGLRINEGIWHDVLIIDRGDKRYYERVKDQGAGNLSLDHEPKISVNTIHGVKGGEADNVIFSNAMGRIPHRQYRRGGRAKDDEARIFYVAATRAKKGLYIKPSPMNAFPLP